MTIVGFIRPVLGDEPDLIVEPCVVLVHLVPGRVGVMDTKTEYVSGPKQWTAPGPWTGAAMFDADNKMLYRILVSPDLHSGETLRLEGI